MRKLLLTVVSYTVAFLVFQNGYSQKVTGCGYIIPPKSYTNKFQSVYEASAIVKQMLDSIKWNENFKLQEKNGIQNAYATIINNARWIVYDNNFLEDIDEYTKTRWASISIMAHEMGHHYHNHVISSKGSTIPTELEADAFSGYIMARLGATKEQSAAAIKAIATDRASATHPAKNDRVNAISQGWDKAGAATPTKNPPVVNTPKPNTPTTPTYPVPTNPGTQTDPNSDPSWIALSMQSNRDEIVYLSDDGKTFQQAVIKAGQPFVFKFEIYNYGWIRLKYYNGYRTFKLTHGADYFIVWNRRINNWTIVQIPN